MAKAAETISIIVKCPPRTNLSSGEAVPDFWSAGHRWPVGETQCEVSPEVFKTLVEEIQRRESILQVVRADTGKVITSPPAPVNEAQAREQRRQRAMSLKHQREVEERRRKDAAEKAADEAAVYRRVAEENKERSRQAKEEREEVERIIAEEERREAAEREKLEKQRRAAGVLVIR